MSHGNLSPRQKMINIMYLILTALLAMNVSAEVLNAFVLVNDSLIKTEKGITAKNSDIYSELGSKYEANKNKVKPWKDKADIVQTQTKEMVEYISALQKDILEFADEDYKSFLDNGTKVIEKKDDREGPLFVMLEDESQGKIRALILKEKLKEYREKVESVLEGVPNSETILSGMKDNLSTDAIVGQEGKPVDWEIANFNQLPLVAVITMLTKLKTDILNTESDAVTSLISQVDAKSFKFTELNAIVKSDQGYVLQGEKYEARIFIAASDTSQDPIIEMADGTILKTDSTGKGIFIGATGAPGLKPIKGKIKVLKPGSATEMLEFPFESEYQVAVPSVSVSPTAMNVFYIGVDNPVEITAAGTPADKINASMSGAGGTITHKGGSAYNVKVKTPGTTNVNVSTNGRGLGSKEFRVKSLPNPITTIGGPTATFFKGGSIPQSTLLALSGINATMENFDFALTFNITQFSLSCSIGGFDESAPSNSRNFTAQQKAIIRKAKKGNRVIIEEVRASGPDGQTRKINDLVLKLL